VARGRLLGILLLVLAVLVTAVPLGPAAAAIVTPFAARFDVNANGAIMLRGNASLTCPIGAGTCANARNGTGSAATEELNDNGYAMVYTDTDRAPVRSPTFPTAVTPASTGSPTRSPTGGAAPRPERSRFR
jgi:hypothetical protein